MNFKLLLGLALACTTMGCATTFSMTPDASVPFAKGEIDAGSVADDGNAKYTLSVEHLGDPAKLNPSATVYVVWLQPKGKEGATVQNMGALKVDSDYSGEHAFSSPFKSFDISVTPEVSADVTKPSGRDVLKASVSNN